jgi:hypothetical protein
MLLLLALAVRLQLAAQPLVLLLLAAQPQLR